MFGFLTSVVRICSVAIQVLTATATFATALLAVLGESWRRPSLVR